jgi:uncharacterized protein YhfF
MTFPVVDGYRAMELGSPGDMRMLLNGLVLDGAKRATAGLRAEYAEEDEEVEAVGERLALVDDELNRIGLIEVTRVDLTTFGEVTWEFARAEGEGFTDLADWRDAHKRFWLREGVEVTDATEVTCIYFELVPPGDDM